MPRVDPVYWADIDFAMKQEYGIPGLPVPHLHNRRFIHRAMVYYHLLEEHYDVVKWAKAWGRIKVMKRNQLIRYHRGLHPDWRGK